MKVVIVSSAFFESSIPLAKYLSKYSQVKFYSLVSTRFINPPNFDLTCTHQITNHSIPYLEYFNNNHYLVNYLNNSGLELQVLLLDDFILKNLWSIKNLAKSIKTDKADYIHFIGHHPFFIPLYLFLFRKRIVHSFHEINFERINGSFRLDLKSTFARLLNNIIVKISIIKKSKIIFHSENVRNQFLARNRDTNSKYIPFGLFEIYRNLPDCNIEFLPQNYFLFFGYVRAYKGVDILIKAIEELNKKNRNKISFVIAGENSKMLYYDPWPENIILIDKFLRDVEISALIKNCKAVIVPYRIASQSGIPNTTFVFNKPVISSNIPGLNEIIIDELNGLLFKSGDHIDLASKIVKLNEDSILYDDLVRNIESKTKFPIPTWDAIAKMTLDFYNS
jgi:glycosyltransferase involved in cell wall biosynthesis